MKVINLLLPLYLFSYSAYSIDFYVWYDEEGVKHVSNVPRHCITPEKTVDLNCIPEGPTNEVRRARTEDSKLRELIADYDALLKEHKRVAAKGEPGAPLQLLSFKWEIKRLQDDIVAQEEVAIESNGGDVADVARAKTVRWISYIDDEVAIETQKGKMRKRWEAEERANR